MANEHESVARWKDDFLPHVVGRLALERPNAKFGEWVTGSSTTAITYAQLANVINGLSWWLVEQLGGPGSYDTNPDVLAYVGPNDVRYGALVLAAMKTGYVLFVTSPRNSPAAHRALFDSLQCQTLITSAPVPPPARIVLDAIKPLRHLTVPSVEELLTTQYPLYVLNKTFQDLRWNPFVVMHTSGTTGLPKPIIWTNDTCMKVLNSKACPTQDGIPSVDGMLLNGKRVLVTLPPFHGALLAHLLLGAIPYGNVVIAPVAAAIPTAQGVVDALKQAPADVAVLVPSVVVELAQSPELLDYCATNLEAILYIGGDLPQDIGDRVAAKIYLRCQWGATETGIVPQLLPRELYPSGPSSRSLWRYIRFHPCVGAMFDEVTDGIYELVLRRKKVLEDTQPCFAVPGLTQLEIYRTKDLFAPHPDIPEAWCWRARADDIIVFLNGEKTNPISMEQHIVANNPALSGALVIGSQRLQAALLIEPASESPLTTEEQAALIERVWPSVEDTNRSAPAHARVEKSFILVVPPDRRLIRAGKGTFMRGPSIDQYTKEIAKLYADADVVTDDHDDGAGEATLHAMGHDGITRIVQQHVRAVTGWSSLGSADSFFDRGMDSLQGLQLTRALRRSFRRHDLALSTVYQNPTVPELVAAILSGKGNGEQDERKVMETLLVTYRELIQKMPASEKNSDARRSRVRASGRVNILITGSTGTVGTHLLRALLDCDGIEHIFCLNRGEDGGRAAQLKSLVVAGLETAGLGSGKRVTFIKADLKQPSIGLDSPTFELLGARVGLVIHAAWPVNFNLALSAFRPQLAGLVNLLNLAAFASAQFVFISSVAAVEGYMGGLAPEEVLNDLDTPAAFGYGRAKFLAELLVDAAAQRLGNCMPATIIRVGQVSGPVRRRGLWNPKEWLPSLVLSSLHLGQVPDNLGPRFDNVDFVPADLLADVLVDLVTTVPAAEEANFRTAVFNIRNPQLTPWRTLLPAITEAAKTHYGDTLQTVSPATWLASLRASSNADDNEAAARNPAVKLLDFFEGLWAESVGDAGVPLHVSQPMAVGRALAASPALRSLEPIGLEWMRKWIEEWVATYLPSVEQLS
ncbi:acetyl-CoA synthetase-like protein [Hypoxylon sp. NC1633]|nr:acetyl-CoA synthetase-like protein [Hypoxylon sp. NC1633]